MATVGEIVRMKREARGLTLAALAAATGVTKGYLSMIENHRVSNPPSDEVLAALETALGIEDGELRRVAAWQVTPQPVKRQLERAATAAELGQDLARWLKTATERRSDGAKSLDKLHKSGELSRRIEGLLHPGEDIKPSPAKGRRTRARDHADDDDATEDPVLFRFQPVINRVAAGYPRDFTDLDYPRNVADEYVSAPGLSDPDAFAARVVGDSMSPNYAEGDIVVFSPAAPITEGCDCFFRLEPDHETTFKRVFFEKKRRVRLQPLNQAYPPRVLDREQISGMYRAVWRFTPLP